MRTMNLRFRKPQHNKIHPKIGVNAYLAPWNSLRLPINGKHSEKYQRTARELLLVSTGHEAVGRSNG